MQPGETIFALSSGALPAAVAVVRLSGPHAFAAVRSLAGGTLPEARQAALVTFREPDGSELDRGLLICFPAPRSFTGEDVAELQVTGSIALVDRLLAILAAQTGLRQAEPGEFARRAVAAGKLGLTEAEGLAALLDAETEAQRGQAMMAAGGAIRQAAEDWRQRLLELRADIEAELDFGESEADVADTIRADGTARIAALRNDIETVLGRHEAARRVRRGFAIAVVGPPNAGKSTLVNALSLSDAAIVSEIAGTTRDVIEVPLDIGGYRAVLIDTAGLREASDPIEREGIRRARERADRADIVLDLGGEADAADARVIRVAAKADIEGRQGDGLRVSARTGQGLDELLTEIGDRLTRLAPPTDLVTTSARQKAHLEETTAALQLAETTDDTVMRAEELRRGADALGRLTGQFETEELLGEVFARFCIGK